MRVVGLRAGQDFLSRMKLTGDPERFEVGYGAAATEMAEEIVPAEHCGDFGDCFFFHRGSSAAAIERVIVGIDPHSEGVSETSDGVRRLEHLPSVEGMKIGIVVLQAFGGALQNFEEAAFVVRSLRKLW